MRRLARLLLHVLAFAVPWEFSLELEEPLGPVARVTALLLAIVAVPAILETRKVRRFSPILWCVLGLYLWFCCSYFWTIDQAATLEKLRAYFQEMMIVWLVLEFADSPRDLRTLLRALVAGSWELAIITIANFVSPEAIANGQIRFVAEGLDPNDTARFLDIAFPLAALLVDGESKWGGKILAWGFFPLGLLAVLLTASRGGFIAAIIAIAGAALLLAWKHSRRVVSGLVITPALVAILLSIVPHDTLDRLSTILEQIQAGNLNDRVNIWAQGWQAFQKAPLFGSGAGSFVTAAGLAPVDTAHNTALSIAVGGGLFGLFLFVLIVVLVLRSLMVVRGPLFLALATSLLVWMVTTLTASVEENRSTWLLFALIAFAGRIAVEQPAGLAACFPSALRSPSVPAAEPSLL